MVTIIAEGEHTTLRGVMSYPYAEPRPFATLPKVSMRRCTPSVLRTTRRGRKSNTVDWKVGSLERPYGTIERLVYFLMIFEWRLISCKGRRIGM
jgi:hypothetical protein